MTFLLMMFYGVLALAALALMQLTILGIVAIHRNFVAHHDAMAIPVAIDGPDASAGV